MFIKQKAKIDIVAVAKVAGVSASTVSRSFNHPELLKHTTRKKIERAVKKLGYIRNRAAQTMHGKRSGTIGLIVPTIDHAIFAEVIQSFSEEVGRAGFTILIASHGYDLQREYKVLRKFLEHRVDAVALIGLDHIEETYQLLEQQEIPSIAIWNYDANSRISCVGANNYDAGWMAAEHLLNLGHTQFGLVFPPMNGNDRASDRLAGATARLTKHGIAVPKHWRFEAPYSISLAKQVSIKMLSHLERPTAILCGNDVIAQGAIYAAHNLGLSIPEEISIIGVGDFKGSEEMEPGLTTVRIPAQSIGRIAGSQITKSISDDETHVTRHKCELKILSRGTTVKC